MLCARRVLQTRRATIQTEKALETGMRTGESANIERGDLDFANHPIRVWANSEWVPKGRRNCVAAVNHETASPLFELRGCEQYTSARTSREGWKRAIAARAQERVPGGGRCRGHTSRPPSDRGHPDGDERDSDGRGPAGPRSPVVPDHAGVEYYVRIGQHEAARKVLKTVRKRARICDLSVTKARKVG